MDWLFSRSPVAGTRHGINPVAARPGYKGIMRRMGMTVEEAEALLGHAEESHVDRLIKMGKFPLTSGLYDYEMNGALEFRNFLLIPRAERTPVPQIHVPNLLAATYRARNDARAV